MALIPTRTDDPYPNYSLAELRTDATIHALGCALSLTALALIIARLGSGLPLWLSLAALAYGFTLMLSNWAALLYHSLPFGGHRQPYRRLDHAAIFLLIAGTYAPITVAISSAVSLAVLALVAGIAAYMAILRLFFWQTPGDRGYIIYLILGWISLLLVYEMATRLPLACLILVLTGGAAYTIGIGFYVRKGLKFANAIWHAFVLLANACNFAAVTIALTHAQ